METTPCGLLKFNEIDTYNFSDAKTNFDRPDELLARLGAHESRFFDYDSISKVGATLNSRFTLNSFQLLGKGEWFYFYINVTLKENIPKTGSKRVLDLPAFYSAIHTQKLGNVGSGRGCGGWINQGGAVNIGTTSGSDTTLSEGERIELAGWYLPKNDLTTAGMPSIGEKSPFFSSYINSMEIIDKACKGANTNLSRHIRDYPLTIKSGVARLGDSVFFTQSSEFTLTEARAARVNEFIFVAVKGKTRNSKSILSSGDVANFNLGTMGPEFDSLVPAPLERDNAGRVVYAYINTSGEIGISAVGRAGGSGTITMPAGEEISVSGYYRLEGS